MCKSTEAAITAKYHVGKSCSKVKFLRGIKITSLVCEAGFSGFSLARTCQENGAPVQAGAAIRILRPAGNGNEEQNYRPAGYTRSGN
jgi:hypothetical protein